MHPRRDDATTAARYDSYRPIHKALRALMAEVLVATGRIDADDAAELAQGLARVRSLLGMLRAHLHHEDQFMHPALEARRPGSACTTAREHDEHLDAIEALETAVRTVETAPAAVRGAALHRLYLRLSLLVAENLEHMHFEETENNAALWAAYSDAELLAIEQALVASLPPDEAMGSLGLMMPVLAPAERHAMMLAMRSGMPPPAFDALLGAVRPQLDARSRAKLDAALGAAPIARAA